MEYALSLVIIAAVAAGIAGALARTWTLHSRLYSLEDRVSVLEGVTNREVKIRAANSRWKPPTKDELTIEAALAAKASQELRPKNWWELNLPRAYEPPR